MKLQRVLVTGGCGFIGSHFVRRLLDAWPNAHVTNLDLLHFASNPDGLADLDRTGRYRFVHGDIRSKQTVEPLVAEADAVVHLAAESHVDRSIKDAEPFVSTNVLGTQVLLEAARRAWTDRTPDACARFLYCSTDEVYGSLDLDAPDRFTEDAAMRPNSPYSASKAGGDMLCRAYRMTYGMDIVVTRCCNAMGTGQFPEKLVPLFVSKLVKDEKVPLYGDGLHVREWIAVEDAADAMRLVLERGAPGEVCNIGSGVEVSNLELTREMLRVLGKPESLIEFVEDRPGHDRRYAVDASKLASIGFRTEFTEWPAMLERTVTGMIGG